MTDMFPDAPASPITLDEQIVCVAREIEMREQVYARRVLAHHMTQKTADKELARMRAVLSTLQSLKDQA